MHKTNRTIYLSLVAIVILFLSSTGLTARAATIENLEIESGSKKIKVTGFCVGQGAAVQIFSTSSSQPFYTAGADCHDNKFEFKDDLGYWKIPDGDYNITIIGKDDNSHSSTATFTIQSAVLPVSDASIVEPIVDLENNSVSGPENDAAKAEITDQTVIPENSSNGLFVQIINFLVEWLKSAIVMIKELVVEKVSTPELCLGKTCIMEDQLKDLLGGKQTPSSASDATTTITN